MVGQLSGQKGDQLSDPMKVAIWTAANLVVPKGNRVKGF